MITGQKQAETIIAIHLFREDDPAALAAIKKVIEEVSTLNFEYEKNTPLSMAVMKDSAALVRLLIEGGAKPDMRLHGKMTALHLAAAYGKSDSLQELLEQGAGKDLQDDQGRTALHFAAAGSMADCVEILLDEGADGSIADNEGTHPIDIIGFTDAEHDEAARLATLEAFCKRDAFSGEKACEELRGPTLVEVNVGPVRVPRFVVEDERTGAKRRTRNEITYDDIEDGNLMVNFHNEMAKGRFWTKNSFDALPVPKVNPMTKEPIRKITKYTAKITSR